MNQIKGIGIHDKETFIKIYNRYSPALLGIISKITKDQEVAESILEEMFVKIWEQSSIGNEGYQRIFSWLSILAREASLDYVNKLTKVKPLVKNTYVSIPEILDLIYYQGLSQTAAAEKLNISLEQVKRGLRSNVMATRIKLEH